jgi:hypothetical protein
MTNSIQSQVLSIIADIENGVSCENCTECGADLGKSSFCPECEAHNPDTLSGFDYIANALDINWILNSDHALKGARILVAFGGPNIWIDTDKQTVEGTWWNESFKAPYSNDEMDIEGACAEVFGC